MSKKKQQPEVNTQQHEEQSNTVPGDLSKARAVLHKRLDLLLDDTINNLNEDNDWQEPKNALLAATFTISAMGPKERTITVSDVTLNPVCTKTDAAMHATLSFKQAINSLDNLLLQQAAREAAQKVA